MNWQDFHFLRPEWLWALIPLLALGWLLKRKWHNQSGWQQVLPGHLYQHLISNASQARQSRPWALLQLAWILATLALAGPTWQRLPQPVYQLQSGTVLLMDMSRSMYAEDLPPNRLTRAKYKAIDLLEQLGEGETGLVAYAGDAFVISPLTSDVQNLTALLPSLSPAIMPVAGSDPYLGLQKAIELLKNAGYQHGDIYWFTDDISNEQQNEVRELLGEHPYRLSILGIGSEDGAPIKLPGGDFLKDRRGAIVLPKLPVSQLKQLARQTNGRFSQIQSDNTDIDYLSSLNPQNRDSVAQSEENKAQFGDKWQEMGPYLLLLLLPIAAYAFRRGLILSLAVVLVLPLGSPPAYAGWWQDLWQRRDQQGMQAFKQQDYQGAAERFADPLWQGSAHYRHGDYQAALDAFRQVDNRQGWYNQANALAQLGELEAALENYNKVLAVEPDNEDAKHNKALVENLLRQQEQQQNNQPQQDQQSQDQQSEQQGDQQTGSPDDGQQQEQNQQSGSQRSDSTGQREQNDNAEQQSDTSQQMGQNSEQQGEQQNNSNAGQETPESEQPNNVQATETEQQQDGESKPSSQAVSQTELSDEQKEQQQRMQQLLRKVPDDPAFLLKRKMQLEHQQRRNQRPPQQQNW